MMGCAHAIAAWALPGALALVIFWVAALLTRGRGR